MIFLKHWPYIFSNKSLLTILSAQKLLYKILLIEWKTTLFLKHRLNQEFVVEQNKSKMLRFKEYLLLETNEIVPFEYKDIEPAKTDHRDHVMGQFFSFIKKGVKTFVN